MTHEIIGYLVLKNPAEDDVKAMCKEGTRKIHFSYENEDYDVPEGLVGEAFVEKIFSRFWVESVIGSSFDMIHAYGLTDNILVLFKSVMEAENDELDSFFGVLEPITVSGKARCCHYMPEEGDVPVMIFNNEEHCWERDAGCDHTDVGKSLFCAYLR